MTTWYSTEEWRSIPGIPQYEASSLGSIRRLGNPNPMKETIHHTGYVVLTINRFPLRPRQWRAHRLVALAFLGLPPEGKDQVNHINGVKSDNRPENLEWCSVSENHAHASRTGLKAKGLRLGAFTHPESRLIGSRNPAAKLNEFSVRCILVSRGSMSELASLFDVSKETIGHIRHGLTWRHLHVND